MKCLLDHNLPPRLLVLLRSWAWVSHADHVIDLGWARADDRTIWAANSTAPALIFTFTKDKDFGVVSATLGFPPKVALLRLGNCPTVGLESHLAMRADELARFAHNMETGLLVLERSP